MIDREYQCPTCGVWGEAPRHWDGLVGSDRVECQHCFDVHEADALPSRAVVSSMIASMVAAAERRLAQALRADVRRHWSQMRAGQRVPGLLHAGVGFDRDWETVRLPSSNFEPCVPTAWRKRLELVFEVDSPLVTRIHKQAWSGSYVVIPEIDILSRWLLESVEARSPHAVTMHLIESHEE